MSKRTRTIFACVMLALALALICAFFSLSGHGKVIARAQHKDAHGYPYTVTVKQFGGRYNIALVEEQRSFRDLLLSSYEFYAGSIPATNATISWPELHSFAVRFDNDIAVDCSWDQSKVIWTKH